MANLLDVILMTFQGLSTSIIDLFFLMTLFVTFMTAYRFGQFNALGKITFKRVREVTVEFIVQSIVIGAVFSLIVVLLGIPVQYSEYLYFLLPLSFLIGFYHIRYTNLIYAATMMGFIGFVMQGQTVGGFTMPNVEINLSGMAMITGLLMLLIGLLMYVTGLTHMIPFVVKKGKVRVLGFGMQRFWAVPIVALVAVDLLVNGETVAMPNWWPLLKLFGTDLENASLFLLPLLLILNHGSVSFAYDPKTQWKHQTLIQSVSGLLLVSAGYLGSSVGNMSGLILLVMILTAVVPEVYWKTLEEGKEACYRLDDPGIYIVGVTKKSLADTLGFLVGDALVMVDEKQITTMHDLESLFKEQLKDRVLRLRRNGVQDILINVNRLDILDATFGLEFLPDQRLKVFDHELIAHMTMMHLMRYTIKKDDSE